VQKQPYPFAAIVPPYDHIRLLQGRRTAKDVNGIQNTVSIFAAYVIQVEVPDISVILEYPGEIPVPADCRLKQISPHD
jgi:hypothetical protein